MRTVEKSARTRSMDKKAKVYKTADEAFQAKHDSMKELLKKCRFKSIEEMKIQ
jgi:hypothetical protein